MKSRFRQFVRSILIAIAIIYGVGLIIYTINKNTDLSNRDIIKKENTGSLKNKLKKELEKIKNSDIKKSGSNK